MGSPIAKIFPTVHGKEFGHKFLNLKILFTLILRVELEKKRVALVAFAYALACMYVIGLIFYLNFLFVMALSPGLNLSQHHTLTTITLRIDYIGTFKHTTHTYLQGTHHQLLLLNLKYKGNPFTSLENYTKFSQGQIHFAVDTSNSLRAKYTELTAMAVTT